MCPPKAPKIEQQTAPAPPPAPATTATPELAFNETASTPAGRKKIGRMSLRTDTSAGKSRVGVQVPKMKKVV